MAARSPGSASTRVMRAASVLARGLVVVSGAMAALLVLVTSASAYWSAAGSGDGTGTTGTLAAPTAVTVPHNSLAGVTVNWTASAGSPTPTGYYVTRSSGGVTAPGCASGASSLLTGASCVDSGVPDGSYTYAVTAKYRSWTATSSPSGSVSVWTPAKLAFTGQPSNTVAGTAITPAVAVTVETAANVAVPIAGMSVNVDIGTNPTGGMLTGAVSGATNPSGVVAFAGLSIDTSGAGYTLIASSPGLTAVSSAAFSISAASAARFVITSAKVSGTAASSPALGPITVAIQDDFGNAVRAPAGGTAVALASNSTGTARFSSASGGVTTTTVLIPVNSTSTTFYYGDTKTGSPTITAGGTLATAAQTETITAGTAAMLAFGQQPTNTAQGAPITPAITIQIQDQFGNLTSSTATVSIAIAHNAGGVLLGIPLGTLQGTTSRVADSGTATFNNLSITGTLGLPLGGIGNGYTLQATSGTLVVTTSSPFNITP